MNKIARVKTIFAILMVLSGIGIFSYPIISNYLANLHASEVVHQYDKQVETMDKEKTDAIKAAADAYNQQLANVNIKNEEGAGREYNSYIDLVDIGEALGYITIPKLGLELPVYEGVSDDVLARGIGHIKETSYPLGGESTHSVLSGHRGLAEAELFSNLDKLERGNQFYLHILDEILAYEVDQITIVEPDDISDLDIIEGEDLCTLVTCTPKGINSHRLLVRGHRVEYTGEEEESEILYQSVHTGTVIQRMVEIWPWLTLAAILVLGAEAFLMLTILRYIRQRMEDD